jgi:hypothetical protein
MSSTIARQSLKPTSRLNMSGRLIIKSISVPDPFVSFAPPGSGTKIIFTDPDPSINTQNIKKKNLVSTIVTS